MASDLPPIKDFEKLAAKCRRNCQAESVLPHLQNNEKKAAPLTLGDLRATIQRSPEQGKTNFTTIWTLSVADLSKSRA
jgi:hypothetical protein